MLKKGCPKLAGPNQHEEDKEAHDVYGHVEHWIYKKIGQRSNQDTTTALLFISSLIS